MGQPWGLSGPQFLGIYASGMAAMVLLPVAFWRVIRYVPGYRIARELDPYQVGYLAGGPQRVAEVIIVEHVESVALRVDSKGRLSEADPAARRGPYAAAVAGLPDGLRTAAARNLIESHPSIGCVARDLRAEGLMIPRRRIAALRLITATGIAALLATGIARFAEAAQNSQTTGFLVLLFVLSIVTGFVLFISLLVSPPRTTRLGAAYLRHLRAAHKAGRLVASEQASGVAVGSRDYLPVTANAGETALLGVALQGFSGMQDQMLRGALLAGLRSSSGSGGSSCAGCGSQVSGGHGCGSHGCGGHGCGGI
jgi:uncharacterized protein (TIGR04222 family)